MTARRTPGMDHEHYTFSPMPGRAPLRWPSEARIAFAPVVYLEHWELDPPEGTLRDPRFGDPFGNFRPDYRSYTWREYGARIGFFRVLDLLDKHRLTATVAANTSAVERYPKLVEACLARGYEFAAHGTHATRMISSAMAAEQEAATISHCIETIERPTGIRPKGWISQDFGQSARTPGLLAERGFSYLSDWPNDDQPYWMTTDPPILSIPCQSEWDDVQLLWHRRLLTPRFPALVEEGFRVLHEEGAQSGRSFTLGIHPWLFGMPHRIRYLDETLTRLGAYANVWCTTLGAISDHMHALTRSAAG
ncbi:MAG: polysaccharide deacetylase family protein [Paracoccaceae bacterium]|nr:polysaccharide deacetylase family protein [Paracoccaceae bacterium]